MRKNRGRFEGDVVAELLPRSFADRERRKITILNIEAWVYPDEMINIVKFLLRLTQIWLDISSVSHIKEPDINYSFFNCSHWLHSSWLDLKEEEKENKMQTKSFYFQYFKKEFEKKVTQKGKRWNIFQYDSPQDIERENKKCISIWFSAGSRERENMTCNV